MQSQSHYTPCSAFLRNETQTWGWVASSSDPAILFDQVTMLPHAAELGTISIILDEDTLIQPADWRVTDITGSGWSLWWRQEEHWHCHAMGASSLSEIGNDFSAVLDCAPQEIRIVPPGQGLPRYLH